MCPLSFKPELSHGVLASRRGQEISWLSGWRLWSQFQLLFLFNISSWSHFYLLNLYLASSVLQLGIHITDLCSLINIQMFRIYLRLTESLDSLDMFLVSSYKNLGIYMIYKVRIIICYVSISFLFSF